MVLEVGTNGIELEVNLDTSSLENSLGTDTTELQQLGGLNGTSGKDDFFLSVDSVGLARSIGDLNTSGHERLLAGVEDDLVGDSVEENLQVGAGLNRVVVRVTCMRSASSGRVHGVSIPGRTVGLASITILRNVDTSSLPRLPVVLDICVLVAGNRDLQGSFAIGRCVPGNVVVLDNIGSWGLESSTLDEVWL